MGLCMAGTSMKKKKRKLKYAEMEVWSLFKYIVILRNESERISYLYHWKCM